MEASKTLKSDKIYKEVCECLCHMNIDHNAYVGGERLCKMELKNELDRENT